MMATVLRLLSRRVGSSRFTFNNTDSTETTLLFNKVSAAHLLTWAYSLLCSMAAQAFEHLVLPVARLQLVLGAGAIEVEKNEKNGWENVVQLQG